MTDEYVQFEREARGTTTHERQVIRLLRSIQTGVWCTALAVVAIPIALALLMMVRL
jgi:hypothetical protein